MGFKIKKTVNGETVWEPIKAKKYTLSKTIEYTGALPITIDANGEPLLDYRIYGNTENGESVGERTENLFDGVLNRGCYAYANGAFVNVPYYVTTNFIPCAPKQQYVFRYITDLSSSIDCGFVFFDSEKGRIDAKYTLPPTGVNIITYTAKSPENAAYLVINIASDSRTTSIIPSDITDFMLVKGSTAPASYIPYGYKLPMSVSDGTTSTTTPIYIGDEPLGEDEYVDYGVGKIWRYNKISITEIAKMPLYGQETITVLAPDNSSFTVESGSTQTYYESIGIYPYVDGNIRFKCRINVEKFSNYGRLMVGIRNSQNSFILAREVTNLGDTDIIIEMDEIPPGSYISIMSTYASPSTFGAYKYTVTGAEISTGTLQDPPVPLPALPTIEGETTFEYDGGEPQPEQMYTKYNSWSGWSDIDNYKMVNGNWTQDVT